ncbi:23S rRNA (uridine2552-2'-O)-methyltransferase [Candidatus Methanophagaceae archaeon]|nr:23S rRNA (uridine2552-2'-O)-methyltransferase [Methanophagales archaeon]
MVKRTELTRDRFYKRAKEEGYRSRSAYKLMQIEDRFKLINTGDVVIDLGAAPGGWSQVAKTWVGDNGVVISVDLQHIEKIEHVVIIKSDITDAEATIKAIKGTNSLKGRDTVDVVISDVAPNLSGNRDYDQFRSLELSKSALNIAAALLRAEGNFVTKIFQGDYYNQFYKAVKDRFRNTKAYSPGASRKRSAEVYVIGKGFRESVQ